MTNVAKTLCFICREESCPTDPPLLALHDEIKEIKNMRTGMKKAPCGTLKPQAADPDWESGIRPVGEELKKLRKARAR